MTDAEFARVRAEFYRYTPAAQAAAYRRMTEEQRAVIRRMMGLVGLR